MIQLAFLNDLTYDGLLDTELSAVKSSGLYVNSGVHTNITVYNILETLAKSKIAFKPYDVNFSYGEFNSSRNSGDIVEDSGKLYQSIVSENVGNPLTDVNSWLETNEDSIRLKVFLFKVRDRLNADLGLIRKPVANEYIYDSTTHGRLEDFSIPNDYAALILEPKGSNYIKFRINQVALRANSTNPVEIKVVNQGRVVDTFNVTPNNGLLEFQEIGAVLEGQGRFMLVFPSQSIKRGNSFTDMHKYSSFTLSTAVGTGVNPESAEYGTINSDIGLGVNLSTFVDSGVYLENNAPEFAQYVRSTFEYMCFELFLHNGGMRRNEVQRTLFDPKFLEFQLTSLQGDTVVSRYRAALKKASERMSNVLDKQLARLSEDVRDGEEGLSVKVSSL